MKKLTATFTLIVVIFVCTSCSITQKKPDSGIWYCEKIGISIEFYMDSLYSQDEPRVGSIRMYDEEGNYQELHARWGYDDVIEFYLESDESGEFAIYSGHYRYKKDNFIICLFSKGDPTDNYKTQIELEEECVFIKVDD